MQCSAPLVSANIFCSVESNQASQMHLIASHDKTPDLFAENDGSAPMILFEILMTVVIMLILMVVVAKATIWQLIN